MKMNPKSFMAQYLLKIVLGEEMPHPTSQTVIPSLYDRPVG
jgi:hypothetical protein